MEILQSYEEKAITSVDALEGILITHGIPLEQWGQGATKRVEDLFDELCAQESHLAIVCGRICRVIQVICADVFYHDAAGQSYRLKQEEQLYYTGHAKTRSHAHAVSEKIKSSESINDALQRGLEEELRIQRAAGIVRLGVEIEDRNSERYLGLLTRYFCYHFLVVLDREDFCPEGYLEIQEDKVNCFSWEVISEE